MSATNPTDFAPKLLEFLLSDSPWLTVGSTVISFVIFWLTTKLCVGERGTFVNSLVYHVVSFVASTVAAVVFVFAAALLPDFVLAVLIAFLVVMIVLAFAIPMHIYEIGFFRALGMLIVYFITTAAGVVLLYGVLAFTALQTSDFPLKWTLADPKPNRTEGDRLWGDALNQEVNRVYTQLQQERKTLNVNDSNAVMQFNSRVEKYNRLRVKQAAELQPESTCASGKCGGNL